ncbi:alginate lyase family protein [Mesorhizobium caraganae]|uniref:alginate lyase family protein n=1 Tax=Mesorhizobium caraganae TaxID=483206 RepID=UPI003ECCEED5
MTSTPAERKATWRRIYLELKRARKYLQSPGSSLGGVLVAAKRTLEHRRDVRLRIRAARHAYPALPIAAAKDSFMLVRIIGNDLEPRHRKGQSFDNASFILDNEPAFPDCDKFWIVNRIADPDEEARIVRLLEGRGQSFVRIPFDLEAYGRIAWDIDRLAAKQLRFSGKSGQSAELTPARYETLIRHSKNRYLMNNNGARNQALEIARTRAKWLMPWDGNCYLTEQAFRQIRGAIEARPYLPYVIVPMARIVENLALLDENFKPPATEEPQIIFRTDTTELFDETYPYGRRPKVEMLWRLGIPGLWDRFRDDPWDFPRPPPSADSGLFQTAGWVARLDSGRAHLEIGRAGFVARSFSRDEAIIAMLDRCDAAVISARLDPSHLVFYDEKALTAASRNKDADLRQLLRLCADQALTRGPFSVTDKTSVAPSGDRHDYFQPGPYWWPDPRKPDGLPFIRRDGERAPGTALYEAGSETYDRTRLQRLLDDTTVLALAATVIDEPSYSNHAAKLIRTWFIDPATRMNPHMRYAQVRFGHDDNEGNGTGIIELKDLYFFLDAVRLIERAGALDATERETFRSWLGSYSTWLDTAPAAVTESYRANNHGVFYDLQRASIAAFLGDSTKLAGIGLHARERLADQIASDGSLPKELARTRPIHYTLFTLQGWTTLARILTSIGDDLWQHRANQGQGLVQALHWLAANIDSRQATEAIDADRRWPLLLDLVRHDPEATIPAAEAGAAKPLFHPDEGIAPFWPWRRG